MRARDVGRCTSLLHRLCEAVYGCASLPPQQDVERQRQNYQGRNKQGPQREEVEVSEVLVFVNKAPPAMGEPYSDSAACATAFSSRPRSSVRVASGPTRGRRARAWFCRDVRPLLLLGCRPNGGRRPLIRYRFFPRRGFTTIGVRPAFNPGGLGNAHLLRLLGFLLLPCWPLVMVLAPDEIGLKLRAPRPNTLCALPPCKCSERP